MSRFGLLISKLTGIMNKDKEEVKESKIIQARIIVSTLSYNTSVWVVDENGKGHTPPVPDPVEEEFLVKPGDKVNGFEVLAITENFIEVNSVMEFTTGNSSTPRTQFIIEKGDSIDLNMYGVCDAVQKTSIKYVESVELTEGAANMDRRDDDYIVTKADWDISPMPEKNAQFTIKRKFSDADINRLKKGHLPEEMEDRWFFYYEDGKAYFHRSWSGNCIFIVAFNFKTNKHIVTVNRDENQYSNTDFDEDIETINDLLN